MVRINHAGRPVSLWEGPAVVLALLAGTVASSLGADSRDSRESPEVRKGGCLFSATVGIAGAALVGAVDDHGSAATAKGLRGHLGELRHGRVTTGTVKLVGLVAAGLCPAGEGSRLDRLSRAGLVAGCANLANLLDVRPGRALKAALLTALPLLVTSAGARGAGQRPALPRTGGAGAAAVVTGAALAALPADLAGRAMLGDTGANALGAALGAALAERLGRTGRLAALAVVTALTLSSERASFTEVIASTPALRALDRWGAAAGGAW